MVVFPKFGVPLKGAYRGLYRDNGNENGSYYVRFRGSGFAKIRGTCLGILMKIRTIVFGVYIGVALFRETNI